MEYLVSKTTSLLKFEVWTSPVVGNPLTNVGMQVQSLVWEDCIYATGQLSLCTQILSPWA